MKNLEVIHIAAGAVYRAFEQKHQRSRAELCRETGFPGQVISIILASFRELGMVEFISSKDPSGMYKIRPDCVEVPDEYLDLIPPTPDCTPMVVWQALVNNTAYGERF